MSISMLADYFLSLDVPTAKQKLVLKIRKSQMKAPVKTPEHLIAEYADLTANRVPHASAMTGGAIWGLSGLEKAFGQRPSTSTSWILDAHQGTLEKLPMLLPSGRVPTSLELLSAVRNLFENLIWLKLFELGPEWGLRFYGRLLRDQIEDLNGLLSKNEEEAALFQELARQDSAIIDTTFSFVKRSTRRTSRQSLRRWMSYVRNRPNWTP